MAELETYFGVLAKFLAASLIVERSLEYLDKILSFLGLSIGRPGVLQRLLGLPVSGIPEEKRVIRKRVIMQTFGILAGIGICYSGKLGIFTNLGIVVKAQPPVWDFILSGILISGGSEPIHQLMNFLTERKEQLKTERLKWEAAQSPGNEAGAFTVFPRIGIAYAGGLFSSEKDLVPRQTNPKFIVLHHSKTKANLLFEEFVSEFAQKQANSRKRASEPLYHSVITYEGEIHHYCPWNAIGVRTARGARLRKNALDLCFIGDFDIPPEKKDNQRIVNAKRPSEEQINSGAKIIALWRLLYDIEERNVIPHVRARENGSSCPGNNFPFDRLVAKSTQIFRQWQNDPQVVKELNKFKKLNHIYVQAT